MSRTLPRNPRLALIAAAVVAVALALAAAVLWRAGLLRGTPPRAATVDYVILDGSKHTTAQWQGQVVVVNFWATTCSICVREMPRLVETYRAHQAQGLQYLAVAMQYDPPAYVVDYAQRAGLPFPVAMDHTGAIARAFGDTAVTPTTFVINRRGEIVKRYVGEPDFGALDALLKRLLAET